MNSDPSLTQRLRRIFTLVILCLLFIVAIAINLSPFFDGRNDLLDFGSFYASGLKLQNRENPYDPNSEYIFDITFPRVDAGGKMMNLNPPISAMLFEGLAGFEPQRAMAAWQILSALLYLMVVFLLWNTYRPKAGPGLVIWALTLAGFWHTLVLGQIYIVMLVFTAVGWIFLKQEKYVEAGVAIGLLIAIKPNFILWPLLLLIGGYALTSIVSIVSALLVSLIPIAFYGTGIYRQWLEASALRLETLRMPGNSSILGLTARFDSIPMGILASVVLVAGLLILVKGRSSQAMGRTGYLSALGIIASLLVSPISWTGYTILLLPIYFCLNEWSWPVVLSAAILSIPFPIVLQLFQNSFPNFVVLGWLYGWALILLLSSVVTKTIITRNIQTS